MLKPTYFNHKLVFVADVHLSETTPRSRTETNFLEVTLAKLAAIEEPEALCIIAGDVFHVWNPRSNEITAFNNCTDSVPFVCVGNHDIPGSNLAKLEDSGLSAAHTIVLSANRGEAFGWMYGHPIAIYSFDHGSPELKSFLESKIVFERKPKVLNVAVVHAPIWERELPHARCYKDIPKHENLDFVVLGDIHQGFGPVKYGETIWVHPGCLTRRSIDERYVVPKAFYLGTDGSFSMRSVPFAPPSEAFKLRTRSFTKGLGEGFLGSVEKVLENKVNDPITLVKLVGDAGGFSVEEQERLIRAIKEIRD